MPMVEFLTHCSRERFREEYMVDADVFVSDFEFCCRKWSRESSTCKWVDNGFNTFLAETELDASFFSFFRSVCCRMWFRDIHADDFIFDFDYEIEERGSTANCRTVCVVYACTRAPG